MPKRRDLSCPCGYGRLFAACCEPLLLGHAQAQTAEQLMRSRYSAYTRRDAAYLRRSWHPDTRPAQLDFNPALEWLGLTVLRCEAGGAEDLSGQVEFRAEARVAGRPFTLHELSRFERTDGRRLYRDGDLLGAGA